MIRCLIVRVGATRFADPSGVAVALFLLLLGGCAPPTYPPLTPAGIAAHRGAPAPIPQFSRDRYVTADGTVLPLKVWLPPGPIPQGVRAVILALHGFDDYSNAFTMPAAVWARYGIATYAYDQRGFGAAPGRLFWPGRAALVADAVTATRVLHRLYPGKPIYLLGESMGAAVAICAETGETGAPMPAVDGVILTAPAVWGRQAMNLPERMALWAAVRLFPAMRLTGRQLHRWPSDNIPMLRALARDPLVIKATRVDAVYGLVNLMSAALRSAPRLDAPLLLQYGAHDEIIPREPVRLFVDHLPPDPAHPRRLAYYAHGYHMLLRDLDGALVAEDVASWVLDRHRALPSREDAAQNDRPWPPKPAGSG